MGKRYWTELEVTNLIVMRAEHVAFDVIANSLGRTTAACHTKYYSSMAKLARTSRYETGDPASLAFKGIEKVQTKHRDAIGRAILRNKGMKVDELSVEVNGDMYPYITTIGPHALLRGESSRDTVIVWLLPDGGAIILLPWKAYEYEYA